MFARSASTVRAAAGRRHASSINVSQIANQATYWAKVSGEVAKQVYVKEGLAPPSVGEFQKVADCATKLAQQAAKDPRGTVATFVKTAEGQSKTDVLRYLAYFVQIVGFFSLGEIIGRRNVVGYKSHH